MSGYLSRLAGAAQGRRSGIRPIVSPLFAPGQDSPAGLIEREEVVVARRRPAGIDVQASASRQADGSAPVPFEYAQPPARADVADHGADEPVEQPVARARGGHQRNRQIDQGSVEAREETRMVREQLVTERLTSVDRIAVGSTRVEDRRKTSNAAWSAPREHEVHIHIGRVEVTAAPPQPAVRPAPRSASKAPSLQDYLKRGSGG